MHPTAPASSGVNIDANDSPQSFQPIEIFLNTRSHNTLQFYKIKSHLIFHKTVISK